MNCADIRKPGGLGVTTTEYDEIRHSVEFEFRDPQRFSHFWRQKCKEAHPDVDRELAVKKEIMV